AASWLVAHDRGAGGMVVPTGRGLEDDVGPDAGTEAVEAVLVDPGGGAGADVLDPTATVDPGAVGLGAVDGFEDDPHPVTTSTIITTPTMTARTGFMLSPFV